MFVRACKLIGIAAALGLLAAAPASAAVRYASPTGVASPSCLISAPCDIATAINGVVFPNPDEVVVLPGDYGSPAAPITTYLISTSVTKIAGTQGLARPRLFFGGAGGIAIYNNGTLSNLSISSTSPTAYPLHIYLSYVDHVYVHATAYNACNFTYDSTITDSACVTDALGKTAINWQQGFDSPMLSKPILRNVTAVATGVGGVGMRVDSTIGPTLAEPAVINSIIRGNGGGDVVAIAPAAAGSHTHVTLDHSNYATAALGPNDTTITPPGSGTNQTAAPQFVNPAGADYHQLLGSPTIDAGVNDAANGAADLDMTARTKGLSTDIGAYEFEPVAINLSKLKFAHPTFRAAGKGASATHIKTAKRTPTGSTVSFFSDLANNVTFTVEQRTTGRKVGKSCQKRSRDNVGRKHCTRYAVLHGSFTIAAAGKTKFTFSGRIGTTKLRKLKPGAYRLRATPSSAGSTGKSVTKKFRIVH